MSPIIRYSVLLVILSAVSVCAVFAQTTPQRTSLVLTVDEAVEIALVSNHVLRAMELDVQNASSQVREAWGSVMPQLDLQTNYTRNLKSPNPFAGSEAGGLFGSLGFLDWLAYNERARTDDNTQTTPISYDEYQRRQNEGLSAVGFQGAGDNPFAVPNQFQGQISLSQTLYNRSAFSAIRGARSFQELAETGLARQRQLIADRVRQAYYQALLASEQAVVAEQSVERTRRTVTEVARMVSTGVSPKSQRLAAEVQLANLETQQVQTENNAALAVDQLKQLLGVPASVHIELTSPLDVIERDAFQRISAENMMDLALANRPDLKQARLAIELNEIDRDMARAGYQPTVRAVASLGYAGNVPDSRTSYLSERDDPFAYRAIDNAFFSSSYWNPNASVGISMSWNLFNGFQTSARVQQRQIAISRARVEYEQLEQTIRLEVERAMRDLRAAEVRLENQQINIERAELSFGYAEARLREGVSTPFEVRDASDQLDQSRIFYLQAVHDYLRATSALETALGSQLPRVMPLRMTQTLSE
jgi:outer membrane protein TolC